MTTTTYRQRLAGLALLFCFAMASQAQTPASKPGPEHQKLSIFFGEWAIDSDLQATPLGPAGKFVGKAKVRSILGGFFMEWRSEGKGPSGPTEYFEIDGYDAVTKKYTWTSFESTGVSESVTYTLDGTNVEYAGTGLDGTKQYKFRGSVVFAKDLSSALEKREVSMDGKTWMPQFQSKWTKTGKGQ